MTTLRFESGLCSPRPRRTSIEVCAARVMRGATPDNATIDESPPGWTCAGGRRARPTDSTPGMGHENRLSTAWSSNRCAPAPAEGDPIANRCARTRACEAIGQPTAQASTDYLGSTWPEGAIWAASSTGSCEIREKAGPTPTPGRKRPKYRTRPNVRAAQQAARCHERAEVSVKTRRPG